MEYNIEDYINYRITRSKETAATAKTLLDEGRLYDALNRIYYSIFYMVSALASKNNFSTSKHSQLQGWFNHNLIKTGIIPNEYSVIYNKAYKYRQQGDYGDFVYFTQEEVAEIYTKMLQFTDFIEKFILNNPN